MWPGRARYTEAGDVLPAKRFRSLAGTKPDRGGIRILRRPSQTRLCRSRCVIEDERTRSSRKAGAVPDERERSAAAATLCCVSEWRAHRRSDERHAFSKLELGRR